MSQTQAYYEIYRDEVLALTRSLVIKNNYVAEAINASLKAINYQVFDEDPTTWKYYLNLNGQYHKSDTLMTVRSMDTREIIDFTKENLRLHRATAREYKPGSVYYNNLVSRYPTQADLINGIISPVPLQTAIDAQDGDILYFDAQYVESNEDTFKEDLEDWVKSFNIRWFNEQFLLLDDLYLPTFIGLLYLNIPNAIEIIRLRNCKTNKVHSFHIRQYLASHNRLDAYIPYLNKEQQLYLYRNIEFIKRNVGKQYIWERLVNRLLTKRGIPLMGYTLEQNLEKMPEELYPEVELVKHDINSSIVQPGYDKITVDQLLTREYTLARDNPSVQYDTEQTLVDKVKSDQFSTLPTKVLDSEVVDRGNSNIKTLEQVLFNQWIHLAATNRYRAYINVVNPATGDYLSLTVKDALILSLYAYGKTRGLETDRIPTLVAYEVLRSPLPSFNELASIVDPKYVPDGMIQAIMDRITPMTEYISTEKFYTDASVLHQEYLKLWELYSFQEHYMTRVYCEQLVKRHFMNIQVKLVDEPLSFEQYFDELGINVVGLSDSEMDSLLVEVVNTATGANLVTVITLGEIQAQLLQLMGTLSSYPLQYLRNLSSTDYRQMGVPAIRAGDIHVQTQSMDRANIVSFDAINYKGKGFETLTVNADKTTPQTALSMATASHLAIDPTVALKEQYNAFAHYRLNALDVGIRGISFTTQQDPTTDGMLMQYDPLT